MVNECYRFIEIKTDVLNQVKDRNSVAISTESFTQVFCTFRLHSVALQPTYKLLNSCHRDCSFLYRT